MVVYLNPAGSLARGRTDKTKKRTEEQEITKDDCIDIVENFYNAYHLQTRMTDAEIEQSKTDVQWCARRYYKNWGVNLKAGKLNNYIDILKSHLKKKISDFIQSDFEFPLYSSLSN
jgi:hypothetical protein